MAEIWPKMCKKRADGYISLGYIILFCEVFAGVIDDGSFLNLNRTDDKTKKVPPYKLVHPSDMTKNEIPYATIVNAKETKKNFQLLPTIEILFNWAISKKVLKKFRTSKGF